MSKNRNEKTKFRFGEYEYEFEIEKQHRKNYAAIKRKYQKECGTTCKVCGTSDSIEYHHVIPLYMGGADTPDNVIPLCHFHHVLIHAKMPTCRSGQGGRPSIASTNKDREKIYDEFICGEIGNKCINKKLGYSSRSPIKNRPDFMKYIKSKGIENVRNLVDIKGADGVLKDGDVVGEITYSDGRKELMYYKDTGANDVVYKHRNIDYSPRNKHIKERVNKS